MFDQLTQVVQGDPPCLNDARFSPEFIDFVNTWSVFCFIMIIVSVLLSFIGIERTPISAYFIFSPTHTSTCSVCPVQAPGSEEWATIGLALFPHRVI